jgi:hypothetical protein
MTGKFSAILSLIFRSDREPTGQPNVAGDSILVMIRVLHMLVFVCGLTLALPPGWCCYNIFARAKAAAPKACCGCNKCHRGKTPTPAVPKDGNCPCVGRVATPAPSPTVIPTSVTPVVGESLAGIDGPFAASVETISIPSLLSRPASNLLNCCWRC